ncbi:MAG: hypothetical protein AAB819_03025 [Patescibacteria group bacterium]
MNFSLAGNILSQYATLLAPVLLGVIAFRIWVYYTRANFIAERKAVLLEIFVPKDVAAPENLMDEVILSLHQMGREQNPYARFFTGAVYPRFSLEITGDGESIRFFIWTEHEYKEFIQTAIRGQYPNLVVTEASDYAGEMRYTPKRKDIILYGLEYIRARADIVAEGKISAMKFSSNPMESVTRLMGTLHKGERVWIQILIQATRVQGKSELYFNAGIRGIYIADRAHFQKTYMRELALVLPGFSASPVTSEIMYPWQDISGIRSAFRSATLYNAYVRRNYFYPPHRRKSFLFTQDEIKKFYNFARGEAFAPALTKNTTARKLEPPANLPV